MTAVLLFGTTVAVAGSQPRKVKVKSVVKASAGMKKASSQQRTISSASALVGTYTAVGGNQRNVASWPVTITTDNSTSNKVWLANLSPHFYEADYQAPTYNYFYGTLNSSKTELHIPVGQRMTGTYSFTGNGTQYNNQIVYIGAYDEYNCSEGYINVHEDDIVIRIENNGSRLVLTDSVFFYSVGSDNTFWMLDEVYNNTVLTKEAGQDDGVITLTTAGTLDTKVSGTETSLVIRGPLNSADLKVLRDMTVDKNLTSLDISGANIVGGDTTKYYRNYTASASNVLPRYLFYNAKLETLVLPTTVTKLEVYCLCQSKLEQITIPTSVINLYGNCFNGASSLTAIYVENGNANYTHYSGVLYSKDGKSLVKYPEGKTGTSYTVNSGVTKIGDQAFSNAKLTSITLPTTLTALGEDVFYGTAITTLTIPASVTSIASSTFSGMVALTSYSVASGSTYLSSDSRGALFDKNKTLLRAYPIANTSTTYSIPSTVTEIEYVAFWENKNLKTITVPNGVKKIGGWAFAFCQSLEEVNIPATVTAIGDDAFYDNNKMKKVTSAITTPFDVADDAFSGTCDVATLYVPAGTKSKYQSKNGWKLFKTIVEQGGSTTPTATGNGTLSNPYNAVAATNVALGLSVGSTSSQKYYIKGKISSIKYTFSSNYGTATFYISDDGTTANQFCVYGTYYLENKPWVTGNPQIAIGDDVIIYGNITNYSGTAETADKKSYVYSHNGMTSISGGVAFNNGTMILKMTTAGNLQTAIASSGYSAANVKELVITGPINGTDIRYIRQLAGIDYNNSSVTATLETLNLENANIVSGGGYYKSPSYATSDNVVGLSMFADTKLKYIFLPESATTIMSQAFGNCKQLMGVTVYNKVTSVPGNLFIDCSALCYIDWQPTRGLTSGMLPTSSVRNPNLLIYVTSSSYAPYTTPNVVIGSTATQVTLTNGYAFWAPREFTATNISYSRSFTKTTGNGSAQGWETITLPFQPTKISHATKGELVPFGRWSGTSDTKKPFWLYGFGSSGFTASNYLSANQPYIIAMPNNTKYDDAYRVNGTVTFSATSATVKASLQAVGTTNGVRTLRPAYQTVEATNNKYVLNANGSQFVTYRAASPFEAYFTTTEANARGFIDIFDELPTGIESIPTVGTDETPENVYDLQGRKVVTPQRGIYIRNGKKVIVR